MRGFLAGAAAALLLMSGGLFLWSSVARTDDRVPRAPAARPASEVEVLGDPPSASEKTREEKRFSRYDRDRNGTVGREEYLLSRRKGYAKLDSDGDGRLSFDEYAVKTVEKFTKADADRSGVLDAGEFATTRIVRKAAARCDCPQAD